MEGVNREQKDARALELFLNIGLNQVSARLASSRLVAAMLNEYYSDSEVALMFRDTVKNRKLRDTLVEVVEEANATTGTEKAIGALLYEVAVKVSTN